MATSQHTAVLVLRLPITGRCGDRRVVRGWTLVADDEFGRQLALQNWCLESGEYASRAHKKRPLALHRIVFAHYHGPVPDGKEIDHINRNKLDNRPENLRAITRSENKANSDRYRNNTSGYTGVYWMKSMSKWAASISVSKKRLYLGCYPTPREAAEVVNEAYRKHFPHIQPPNL